jgi:hypothetical protein
MLYGADGTWWNVRNGVPEFIGLRVTQDIAAQKRFEALRVVTCRRGVARIITDDTGHIGDGRTSLFQALNIVVRAGAKRVGLVGADMTLDYGMHWHGPHERGLNNPRTAMIERWRNNMDGVAGELAELGVAVWNLSPISTLKNYRMATLQEFLSV